MFFMRDMRRQKPDTLYYITTKDITTELWKEWNKRENDRNKEREREKRKKALYHCNWKKIPCYSCLIKNGCHSIPIYNSCGGSLPKETRDKICPELSEELRDELFPDIF